MSKLQSTSLPFRVHFSDGSSQNFNAIDAKEARKFAESVAKQRRVTISKIKLVRENA